MDAGCWRLDTEYWILDTGCFFKKLSHVVTYTLVTTRYYLLATSYSLLATNHSPLTIIITCA